MSVASILDSVKRLGAIEVFRPILTRNLITAEFHEEAALKSDTRMDAAFDHINRERSAAGKKPHYPAIRYHIILPPQFHDISNRLEFILDLGEIDFQYLALRQEKGVDPAVKKYIKQRINAVAVRLPAHLQSKDPYLNNKNVGLLGVQIVLITSDGYTLLRRRGKDVLEYKQAWDVSFSGYSGVEVIQGEHFDLGNTVEFELDKEIKTLRGKPGEIRFTALHLSNTSGTTVMLGFWDVETTRTELMSYIKKKSAKVIQIGNGALLFETTIPPKEEYVKDYWNLIAKFDGPTIAEALIQAEDLIIKHEALTLEEASRTSEPYTFVPAVHASLLLALSAHGRSTADLVIQSG